MTESTLLVITGLGISPYAARGLTQTLEPIEAAANLQRTIDGALADFGYDQFRKYKTTISGSDQRPPAVDGKWQGLSLVVKCISELSYVTSGGSPQRPVVTGSSYVEGDFTFYRPELTMRLTGFTMATDEWAAGVNWSMSLEEI